MEEPFAESAAGDEAEEANAGDDGEDDEEVGEEAGGAEAQPAAIRTVTNECFMRLTLQRGAFSQ